MLPHGQVSAPVPVRREREGVGDGEEAKVERARRGTGLPAANIASIIPIEVLSSTRSQYSPCLRVEVASPEDGEGRAFEALQDEARGREG